MKTSKFLGLAMAIACLTTTACNTVEGAGKDLQSAGGAVEDVAKDTKD